MEEDILKQFRVKFGSREQWIKAPANTHFVKRSQIDFYNNLEAFLLTACKESYERGKKDREKELTQNALMNGSRNYHGSTMLSHKEKGDNT